jgi:hypothetical protein
VNKKVIAQEKEKGSSVHIGEIIREWREGGEEPLTRDTLAVRTGRCVSTIRNWETGRDPRVSDIVDLEHAKPGLLKAIVSAVRAKRLARPERPRRRRRSRANGAAAAAR